MSINEITQSKNFCIVMRRKLVITRRVNYATFKTIHKTEEWRTEECGTPLFGENSGVCNSCLKGWGVERNYIVDTQENKDLISEAKKQK